MIHTVCTYTCACAGADESCNGITAEVLVRGKEETLLVSQGLTYA